MTAASTSDARKRRIVAADPVEVVAQVLASVCPDCRRPYATDADWDDIPEGEGNHLCWGQWSGCYEAPSVTIAELAVTALRAEGLLA